MIHSPATDFKKFHRSTVGGGNAPGNKVMHQKDTEEDCKLANMDVKPSTSSKYL